MKDRNSWLVARSSWLQLILAFLFGWGAVGLWWGLTAGLSAVGVALAVRFHLLSGRVIERA